MRPQLHTAIAGFASEVAMAMNVPLGQFRLRPGDYVPELMPPAEQSTGGGVRALQRLRLVPQKDGFPTLVIGSVNVSSNTAELRSFAYVDRAHQRQFKRTVPLSFEDYRGLLDHLAPILKQMNIAPAVVEASADDADEILPAGSNEANPWLALVLGGVGAAVVFAVIAYFWLHRG